MLDGLQTLLFKKYNEATLAPFIIAKYDSKSTDPEVWVNQFLSQLSTLEDHPDVLKVHKTEKETEYKVDSASIKSMLKFLNYKPLKLSKKFIFIFDAHDLSVILSNKLLKVFEELESHFCLILMVPDNAFMLATVESRAIKQQIPSPVNNLPVASATESFSTPMELMNYLKQNASSMDEKNFLEERIKTILEQSHNDLESFYQIEALLKTLKDFEISANFNNSKISRMTRLFP